MLGHVFSYVGGGAQGPSLFYGQISNSSLSNVRISGTPATAWRADRNQGWYSFSAHSWPSARKTAAVPSNESETMSWKTKWSFSAGKRGPLDDRVSQLTSPSQIVDDSYLHGLRVYRDTVSGAVRLQASVHKGEMRR